MPGQNRETKKLSLLPKRSPDVDTVARAVGRAERNSFVGTELTRTSGLGLNARQDIVGAVGISMASRGREVISEMAAECVTQEEKAIAFDYAHAFHARSVQAYDEFMARAYDQ